jgi:hypothetical protein
MKANQWARQHRAALVPAGSTGYTYNNFYAPCYSTPPIAIPWPFQDQPQYKNAKGCRTLFDKGAHSPEASAGTNSICASFCSSRWLD